MREINEKVLKEMVEAIVHEVSPEKIIMFGSRARGSGAAHSDVDILIVEKDPFTQTRSRWKEISQLWDIVANFRIPVDILLYSQDEIEKWRNIKQHVISTALSEGVLLYERN